MITPLFYFDLKLGQFSITLIEKNGARNIILSVYETALIFMQQCIDCIAKIV